MKVFATLATILGVAHATPEARTYTPHQVGSMRSGLQQHNNVMGMSSENIMSNVRMASPYQAQAGPRQYHLQDEFGNFEYAYANKDSEKMEKGNDMSVRGRYAYIMSDGVLRRVDYIADNDGFHVLQDNADTSKSQERIKRSVEPDLIQTRMTSFMDSSSLRDDSRTNPNVYNMMGQDMSKNMMQRDRMNQMSSQRNMYSMMDRSSNMKDNNMMGRNMMNEKMMGRNIMGRKRMDENMMGRDRMDKNMMGRNIMGQNMYSNMMGRDMSSNTMNHNMISKDNIRKMMGQEMMEKNMMGRNIMGQQDAYSNMMGRDMSSNVMNRNMMGQDMMNLNMMGQDMLNRNMMGQDMINRNMMGQEMSSNMMGRDMSSNMMNAYGNDVNRLPLDQRNTMNQRMQIEQIPQSVASRNTFF